MTHFIRAIIILFCAYILLLPAVSAQAGLDGSQRVEQLFYKGKKMYANKNYSAAHNFFAGYVAAAPSWASKQTEAESYLLVCNLLLGKEGAEKAILSLLCKQPKHQQAHMMTLQLGDHYFSKAQYKLAYKQFANSLEIAPFPEAEQGAWYFKYGYCFLELKQYEAAQKYFKIASEHCVDCASKAYYFYAHTLYLNGSNDLAIEAFLRLKDEYGYGTTVDHYLAQLYFAQDAFDNSLTYARAALEEGDESRTDKMLRVAGLSAYFLKDYTKAIAYLDRYADAGYADVSDLYYLGLSHYALEDYQALVNILASVSTPDSGLFQNIHLLLGNSYFQLEEKQKAYESYRIASNIGVDKHIQEQCLYYSILLAYDLGLPHDEVYKQLTLFTSSYPESPYLNRLGAIEGRLLLESKQYINSYNKLVLGVNSQEDRTVLQGVAYMAAGELKSLGNLAEAVNFYGKSMASGGDDEKLYSESLFWQSECYLGLGAYDLAEQGYLSFIARTGVKSLNEYVLAFYSLGYCNFRREMYDKAIYYFTEFIELGKGRASVERLADAHNRVGDSYMVSRSFEEALEAYDMAVGADGREAAYALFQQALIHGLQQEPELKIMRLSALLKGMPDSEYRDDAYFELGNTYLQQGDLSLALQQYKALTQFESQESPLYKKALLQQGLIYYNQGRSSDAEAVYRILLENYPETEEAELALESLGELSVENHTIEEHIAYAEKQGGSLYTEEYVESLRFKAAEQAFSEGAYPAALNHLSSLFRSFPGSRFEVQARYYQGECYRQLGEYEQALAPYEYVIKHDKDGVFRQDALLRAAQIYANDMRSEEALSLLRELRKMDLDPSLMQSVMMVEMDCEYALANWKQVLELADALEKAMEAEPKLLSILLFRKGKAAFYLKNYDLALACFEAVQVDLQTLEGAEASYLVSELLFERSPIEAEENIKRVMHVGTPHTYWLVRNMLLMVEICVDQQRYLEARAYLESVQANYKGEDAIVLKKIDELLKSLPQD